MKIKHISGDEQRQILTAMVVDRTVLGRIASKWSNGLFKNDYANLVGSWCVSYFKKYEKAPMKNIESLFKSWAEEQPNEKQVEIVSDFLQTLSDNYKLLKKDINSEYILDLAGKCFNKWKLELLVDSVQADISAGKSNKAEKKIINFNKIELGCGSGVDIIQDMEAMRGAFEENREPIINMPGGLGKFFGKSLERGGFVSFSAPEKRGKTFWLAELAYHAMLQRRKVAFFGAGDMTQNQMMRRLMSRISQHPIYPCEVRIPIKIKYKPDEDRTVVKFKRRSFKEGLDWRKAYKACKVLRRTRLKTKEPLFKLACFPNDTLTIQMIKDMVSEWNTQSGWTPDVIVIDYADILCADYQGLEGREKIDKIWKQLRSLSMSLHCLVLTATQSNRGSYEAKTISKTHTGEDKRKLAHVTGMVGLNQTPEEKQMGVYRLNWVGRREDEFSENKCVYVASCLGISNPAIKSIF